MGIGSTSFPASLDTADDLVRATNNASTQLSGSINNSTTSIGVNSTSLFPSSGIIRINQEIISYTGLSGGNTFTGCSRGFEGTTASSHQNNDTVFLDITAASNNVKNDAIIAVETKLGTGSSTPSANTVLRGTGTGTSAYGAVVNGDVASNAAIDHSKLAGMTAGQVLIGNASNVPTSTAVTGDVTITSGGVTTISNNAVTYGKMQDVTATSRVIGRKTAGSGDPEECTLSEVLDFVGSAAQGDLLYRGASSWTRLAAGTSGQVLQTQGTGANPQWATATASGSTFKNRLMNGDFSVAQRGTSFTSVSLYTNNDDEYVLDRWYVLSDGNDAVDVTQATDVPSNGPLYSIGLDVETVTKKFGIAQIIERVNCQGLIGNSVSLSFKARVSSTAKLDNVKAAIVSWSGTADAVTSDIVSTWGVEGTNPTLIANATYENSPANLTVTTSWATFKIENIAIDTANAKNVIIFIWSDVTDTTLGDFLYITDVQLEAGATATEYERLPYDVQLAQCQRYFVSFGGFGGFGNTAGERFFGGWYSATQALAFMTFPVMMRTQPTGITTNLPGTANNWRGYWAGGNQNYFVSYAVNQALAFMYQAAGVANGLVRLWHQQPVGTDTTAPQAGDVYFLYPNQSTALCGWNGAEL